MCNNKAQSEIRRETSVRKKAACEENLALGVAGTPSRDNGYLPSETACGEKKSVLLLSVVEKGGRTRRRKTGVDCPMSGTPPTGERGMRGGERCGEKGKKSSARLSQKKSLDRRKETVQGGAPIH